MENIGMLIFGGVCVLGVYIGYKIYMKHRCPICRKLFCKCK